MREKIKNRLISLYQRAIAIFQKEKILKNFKMMKKNWYYFALVLIIFMIAVPVIHSNSDDQAVTGEESSQNMVESNTPTYRGVPLDLFSENQNNRTVSEEVLKEEESEEAARIVPLDELREHLSSETQKAHENAAPIAHNDEESSETYEQPSLSMNWPVEEKIIKEYGFGYSTVFEDYRFNPGVNLEAQENIEVISAAAGRVLKITEDSKFNKGVLIDHGSEVTTFYGNLGEVKVKENQKLAAGEAIGTVGKNGFQSAGLAPNLYFEIRHNSDSVDPKEIIKQ